MHPHHLVATIAAAAPDTESITANTTDLRLRRLLSLRRHPLRRRLEGAVMPSRIIHSGGGLATEAVAEEGLGVHC